MAKLPHVIRTVFLYFLPHSLNFSSWGSLHKPGRAFQTQSAVEISLSNRAMRDESENYNQLTSHICIIENNKRAREDCKEVFVRVSTKEGTSIPTTLLS